LSGRGSVHGRRRAGLLAGRDREGAPDKDWYLFFADPKNAAAWVDRFIVILKRE